MKKLVLRLVVLMVLLFMTAHVRAQSPTISYLIPDIGAPGMNVYIEIVAPYDKNGGYGPDTMYSNNPGDYVRVVCSNLSDITKLTFGPVVVSWNGRVISTQVFVNSCPFPNSSNWQALDSSFIVPLKVIVNGQSSNSDSFFIVKPFPAINTSGNGVFGSGGIWGIRSKRGAMIFDSITLGAGTYTVSTTDCDPYTTGNQGYLPVTILSKGRVSLAGNAILSVSAAGINAGPGGGGGSMGDGPTSDVGGAGFTGGSPGECPGTGGSGSGSVGTSSRGGTALNGLIPEPSNIPQCEYYGGTGNPFIPEGGGVLDNTKHEGDGNGGGFGTAGDDGRGERSNAPEKGGIVNGNAMLVPLMGGSGGGGGNEFCSCDDVSPGAAGGGGGGAILLYGSQLNLSGASKITSDGASGVSGGVGCVGHGSVGGSGSGGGIILESKLPASVSWVTLSGGTSIHTHALAGNGGNGRYRIDGPITSSIATTPALTPYVGLSTDTASAFNGSVTLTGTGNGNLIRIFAKTGSDPWAVVANIASYGNTGWSKTLTLDPTKVTYLVALQSVTSPNTTNATREPSWVMSQAAANILGFAGHGSDIPTLLAHTFSTISACIDTSIYDYLSIGCSQFRLDSIKLLDTAGVFHLDSKQVVPRLVDFNKSDSVHLIFHPNGRGGVFGARVHLYGTVVGGASYDTLLTLVASSVANGSPLPTVTSSPFGLVTSCTDGDGYTFVHVGCTQFRIDSAKIEQDTAGVFHLDPFLKLPLVVDGNKSDTLHVIFHPNHRIGGFGARLHLFGTSASTGLPYDTVITLLAGSTPAPPNFYSTAYQVLWNMPECSDADTTITYVNKGCDSILVDSLHLAQGVTLTSQGLTLPKKIAPNGSITLRVHFSPQGLQGDSLITSLFYSSVGFHDSIHVPVYAQPQPSPPNLSANHTSINFGTVPSCRTLDTTLVLKNTGCDSLTIESLSNIGFGFSIDPASLPISLAKGESDTIRVHYHPQTSSDIQTITVHTTHGNKRGMTTVNLTGHLSITTLSVASEPIDLSAMAICGSADTTIAISNPGCDTITITAADLSPSGDIQLSGLSLPIILLPGKDTVLRIHFAADHQEHISSMLSLEYHIRDLFQDKIQIPITANATAPQENVQLTGNALDLQQWQICVSSLLHIKIENQSCDTLIFYAKNIVGDSDFRIVKGLDTAALAPKETTQIDLILKPQAKGHRSAMVHVLYWNKNKSSGIHDSLIALAADITNGTAHMQSSIPSAQLGTLNLCSTADTTISIHNTGCDTLIVNAGSLDNRYFNLSPTAFPYHIPPDSTVTWHVTTDMDTTGRPSSLSSALSFTSTNADNTLPPIPLSYNIRYADPLALRLAPLTTTAKNDTAIYYDIRYPANLASYGVNEIVFNMHADANLFDYVMNQSPNTVTEASTIVNGIQNYRFDVTGSPIQQDPNGTIAKIWFKTYLSLTTHTNVSIDSIRLNPSDPDFEKCIAFTTGGADTTFDLVTVCGDNLFQQAMAGDKLTLRVVEQDGEPIVYIHSPMNGVAHVLMSNVLGVPVYSEDIELVKGDRQYRFERPVISEPLFLTISDDLGERAFGRLITIR